MVVSVFDRRHLFFRSSWDDTALCLGVQDEKGELRGRWRTSLDIITVMTLDLPRVTPSTQ